VQEGERLAVSVLPILGKPATAIEPCESALDDPTLGQDDEPICLIGPPDDFDAQVRANAREGSREYGSLIRGVGKQRSQERVHSKQRRHDENTAVAILNIGRVNDGVEQEA
jgi:hypothetical protein